MPLIIIFPLIFSIDNYYAVHIRRQHTAVQREQEEVSRLHFLIYDHQHVLILFLFLFFVLLCFCFSALLIFLFLGGGGGRRRVRSRSEADVKGLVRCKQLSN